MNRSEREPIKSKEYKKKGKETKEKLKIGKEWGRLVIYKMELAILPENKHLNTAKEERKQSVQKIG